MAILSEADRDDVRAAISQRLSDNWIPISLTKADLKAAVDAADQWVEDNKLLYNAALPLAAQTELTASQKAELLKFVVTKRFKRGS